MAQTFEGAPFLNPGERPAFIPDIHFLFDRLVSTVPVMGQVDLIDHESATISHEVMVTDHDMLASAGFEPTVSEVYISVDDASLEPSDADEHRVTVIYQYQGTQGEEEIQHALIFAQTRPTMRTLVCFGMTRVILHLNAST